MNFRGAVSAFTVVVSFLCFVTATQTARALPYFISIQPIQVCTDNGQTCANPTREVFETATATIWAQAGIEVRFQDWNVLNSSAYYHLQTGQEFVNLMYENSVKDPFPLTINMFFVEDINGSGSYFGEAFVSGDGIAIGSAALLAANRIDTIAHEIGHNLGLKHTTLGAGGPENLMTDGGARAVPGSVEEIGPDGLGLDMLTGEQIDKVLLSQFVQDNPVSEPLPPPPTQPLTQSEQIDAPAGLTPLLVGALLALVMTHRRRDEEDAPALAA